MNLKAVVVIVAILIVASGMQESDAAVPWSPSNGRSIKKVKSVALNKVIFLIFTMIHVFLLFTPQLPFQKNFHIGGKKKNVLIDQTYT